MAEKVLTYEEFTGSSERTPEKVAAYAEYLKNHSDAKVQFLTKK